MAEIAPQFDAGLVLGKFYPLTRGHQHLIEAARARSRRLYVALGHRPDEAIPASTRAAWIRRLYPDVTVVVLSDTLPSYPSECATAEEFYSTWTRALREVCGGGSPDALFTSEDYGDVAARYLGCTHVLVDRERKAVPISATRVRGDPFACWEYLDPVVRSYFVKTVCIFGPESTGKSALAMDLARRFNTVCQPEFARDFLGERHCAYEDMELIARGHFAQHAAYKEQANRVLFMDTDAITTLVFSEHYYGRVPEYVREMADRAKNMVSLYLLTEIDVPWVADTSRDLGEPSQRRHMRHQLIEQMERRGLPYVVVSGTWRERVQRAVCAVRERIFATAGSTP